MQMLLWTVSVGLWSNALAQQKGKQEEHPYMPLLRCTKNGKCKQEDLALTLDASWRNLRNSTYNAWNPCIVAEGLWNARLCPDPKTCAKNCAVDGLTEEDYVNLHGITSIDGGVQQNYITPTQYGLNVGSRLYLLDGEHTYYKFKLLNREFAFDIDISEIPCGLNAALYFVEMPANGGKGVGNNGAGAQYGTGYCDARCPHSSNFINGEANMEWSYGSCCAEMDLWEGNKMAQALTAHACSTKGLTRCEDTACGDTNQGEHYQGICDKDGCDFNPFRMGDHDFYGPGKTINSEGKKPVTVVTQFVTDDGTDDGNLVAIKRQYMVGSFVIPNSQSKIEGIHGNSLTDDFCNANKDKFKATRGADNPKGDFNQFKEKGGMAAMGAALKRGMVLSFSIWDDAGSNMRWLDSADPKGLPETSPGVLRGPCSKADGDQHKLHIHAQRSSVKYTNLRFGPIGSSAASIGNGVVAEFKKDTVQVPAAVQQWQRSISVAIISAGALLAIAGLAGAGYSRSRSCHRSLVASHALAEQSLLPYESVSGDHSSDAGSA